MEDDRRHIVPIVPIVPIVAIDRVLKIINKGLVLLYFYFMFLREGTGWLQMGDYYSTLLHALSRISYVRFRLGHCH